MPLSATSWNFLFLKSTRSNAKYLSGQTNKQMFAQPLETPYNTQKSKKVKFFQPNTQKRLLNRLRRQLPWTATITWISMITKKVSIITESQT